MTISINNRTYVGMSNLILRRSADNLLMTWPKPANFTLTTGIEQRVQESRNEQGRRVRARTYITGEMPEMTISYNHMQPEMIAFSVGNQLATGTFATQIPKLLQVTQGEYPAQLTGYLGFGAEADLIGIAAPDGIGILASVTRGPVSVPLTPAAYGSYSTWRATDDTFGVGADGALAFSDNLVENKEVVALLYPYEVTGFALSDVLIGEHFISALLVDTENQVTVFEAYAATPNLDGSAIDPSQEGFELRLFLNNPPGECRAWQMYATDLKVGCL